MSAVNRSKAIKDSTLLFRDLMLNTITDPLTGRTSPSRFVATAWPERDVQYPVITVQQQGWSTIPLGMSTSETLATINAEVNVWSKSAQECDSLAGSVVAIFEQNQSVTRASGVFDLRFNNVTSIDEPGKAGIHRKVIELSYIYPSSV